MPLRAIIEKVNGSVESMSDNVPQNSVRPRVTNTNIIPTKVIGNNLMLIDEKNQKVQFLKMTTKDALKNYIGVTSGNTSIYNFLDIIGYEVLENNHSVTKGNLGGALVGGLAFGETGAVLGSILGAKKTFEVCNSLQVKVTVKNFDSSTIFVELLDGKVSKNSSKYKNAVKDAARIISAIQIIMAMNQ